MCLCLHRMCPIFQISNVTGENLDLLKMFLNLLSPRTSYREEEPAEFQIDDTYSVPVRNLVLRRAICHVSETEHHVKWGFAWKGWTPLLLSCGG